MRLVSGGEPKSIRNVLFQAMSDVWQFWPPMRLLRIILQARLVVHWSHRYATKTTRQTHAWAVARLHAPWTGIGAQRLGSRLQRHGGQVQTFSPFALVSCISCSIVSMLDRWSQHAQRMRACMILPSTTPSKRL